MAWENVKSASKREVLENRTFQLIIIAIQDDYIACISRENFNVGFYGCERKQVESFDEN